MTAKKVTRNKPRAKTNGKPAKTKQAAGKKMTSSRTAPRPRPNVEAEFQLKLEQRVEKIAMQLAELRRVVEKEFAQDLRSTREHAEKSFAFDKQRFERIVRQIRDDNKELGSRLGKFGAEHEDLKGATSHASETARTLEEYYKKLTSKDA